MNSLLRVELLRFRSRRAVQAIGLGALVLVVAMMCGQFVTHSKNDSEALRAFRAERAATYQADLQSYRSTLASIGSAQLPPSAHEVTLTEYMDGMDFLGGRTPVPTKDFIVVTELRESVKVVTVIFAFAAFLMGATSAGAEWSVGTMQALLFWESRRWRVLGAKLAALACGVTVLTVVGQLVMHAMGYAVGLARGSVADVTTGWWASQGLAAGRGVLVVVVTGVLGFLIAFATRNTGFALGVALLYIAAVESLLLKWRPHLVRYSLRGNMNAFLDLGRHFAGAKGSVISITATAAAVTLLCYVAVLVVITGVRFQRRDVA